MSEHPALRIPEGDPSKQAPRGPIDLPFAKRAFDIVVSATSLLLTLPLAVLVIVLMATEQLLDPAARGPFLYKETRISKGEPIPFYKFRAFKMSAIRSMKEELGYIETKLLEWDRSSMTTVGRLIQRVYLDEIPQLISILRGDMTLVGPRPTNPSRSTLLRSQGWQSKELMKGGLTGAYQSRKGDADLPKSDLEMDLEYIDFVARSSGWKVLLYDLGVLLRTVRIVWRAGGV